MNASHTPGPWNRNIPPAAKYPIVYAGRNTHVAQVKDCGAETEANCNLIAAAPDLLAALQFILTEACVDADDKRLALDALSAIRHECRAAIAKATGKGEA